MSTQAFKIYSNNQSNLFFPPPPIITGNSTRPPLSSHYMSWNIPGARSSTRNFAPGQGTTVPPTPSSTSSSNKSNRGAGNGNTIPYDGTHDINLEGTPPGNMMMGATGGGISSRNTNGGPGAFFLSPGAGPDAGGRFHWPFASIPATQGSAGGGFVSAGPPGADDGSMMDWGGPPSSSSPAFMMQTKIEAPGTPGMHGMDGSGAGYQQQQQQQQSSTTPRMVPPPPSSMDGMRPMPVFMLGPQGPMTGPPPPSVSGSAGGQQQQQGNPTYTMATHVVPTQFMSMPSQANSMPPPQQGVFNPPPSTYHQQQQQHQTSNQPIAPRPHTYQPPILPRTDGAIAMPKAMSLKDEEDSSSVAQDELMTDERKKRLRNEREQKR